MTTTVSPSLFRGEQKSHLAVEHAIRKLAVTNRKGSRAFHAANTGRLFADWTTSIQSNDSQLWTALRSLRARSRDLCRNDDYMKRFMWLTKSNVIGPDGIKLQMDIRTQGSDDAELDEKANNAVEEAWKRFGDKDNFTVTGQLGRADFEQLAWEQAVRDGEILFRKVRSKSLPFGFTLQPIEVDYLDEDHHAILPGGAFIRMGVEFDVWRRPVAYWLRTDHPGDSFFPRTRATRRIRVSADEIVHRFVPSYFEQSRGCPWGNTAMARLKMLGSYEEAALVAARIGASKMGFFTRRPDANGNYSGDGADSDGNKITEVEPGVFEELPNGMELATFDPQYPHTEHSQFVKAMLRGVAAGLVCSYNSLANDLEGVNYSSLREGKLQDQDAYLLFQGWFIRQVEADIFRDWLEMALLSGAIPGYTSFAALHRPKFNGRRWQWVDPEKEINADIKAIEAGIIPPDEVQACRGADLDDVYRRFARAKKLREKYGLEFPAMFTKPEKATKESYE